MNRIEVLDRYQAKLDLKRQRLKDKLATLVDSRFDLLQQQVNLVRNRILRDDRHRTHGKTGHGRDPPLRPLLGPGSFF